MISEWSMSSKFIVCCGGGGGVNTYLVAILIFSIVTIQCLVDISQYNFCSLLGFFLCYVKAPVLDKSTRLALM